MKVLMLCSEMLVADGGGGGGESGRVLLLKMWNIEDQSRHPLLLSRI